MSVNDDSAAKVIHRFVSTVRFLRPLRLLDDLCPRLAVDARCLVCPSIISFAVGVLSAALLLSVCTFRGHLIYDLSLSLSLSLYIYIYIYIWLLKQNR